MRQDDDDELPADELPPEAADLEPTDPATIAPDEGNSPGPTGVNGGTV